MYSDDNTVLTLNRFPDILNTQFTISRKPLYNADVKWGAVPLFGNFFQVIKMIIEFFIYLEISDLNIS